MCDFIIAHGALFEFALGGRADASSAPPPGRALSFLLPLVQVRIFISSLSAIALKSPMLKVERLIHGGQGGGILRFLDRNPL
jgi:hypothetical protein